MTGFSPLGSTSLGEAGGFPDLTASLAVQETGSDTASGDLVVSLSLALTAQESTTDTVSGAVDVVVDASFSVQETGVDTLSANLDAISTAALLVQEAYGPDTASASAAVAVDLSLTAQETGSDSLTASIEHEYVYLRPDGTVSAGSWQRNDGSTTDLHLALDEATPDDADYIRSGDDLATDTARLSMSDLAGSVDTEQNVVIRYRYYSVGDQAVGLTVLLKEGATTIASQSHADIPASVTESEFLLTPVQIAAITDWNDLEVELLSEVA